MLNGAILLMMGCEGGDDKLGDSLTESPTADSRTTDSPTIHDDSDPPADDSVGRDSSSDSGDSPPDTGDPPPECVGGLDTTLRVLKLCGPGELGDRGGGIGDMDGDGAIDLALESPGYLATTFLPGHFGAGTDLVRADEPHYDGPIGSFGIPVGDIDGDGHTGVVMNFADGLLLFDGPAFPSTSTDAWASLVDGGGYNVYWGKSYAIGDMTGDGPDDVAATVSDATYGTYNGLVFTSPLAAVTTADQADYVLSDLVEGETAVYVLPDAIRDLNADGVGDLLWIANLNSPRYEYAFNISEGPLREGIALDGSLVHQESGFRSDSQVCGGYELGDFDADGYPDLATNTCVDDAPLTTFLTATIFRGPFGTQAWEDAAATIEFPNIELSAQTASEDLTGDGVEDLAIGTDDPTGGDLRGTVRVFSGATLSGALTQDDAVLTVVGEDDGDQFGIYILEVPGDLDGDGFADILTSAAENLGDGVNRGSVYILFGGW